jgi:hypothetical protein
VRIVPTRGYAVVRIGKCYFRCATSDGLGGKAWSTEVMGKFLDGVYFPVIVSFGD